MNKKSRDFMWWFRFWLIISVCISAFFYDSINSSAATAYLDIASFEVIGSSFRCDDLVIEVPEELYSMVPGQIYEIEYSTSVDFLISDYCVMKNFSVTLDFREFFDTVDYSFNILNLQSDQILSGGVFKDSKTGKLYIKAPQSVGSTYLTVDVSGYLEEFDYESDHYLNSFRFGFDVVSLTPLSVDEAAIYQDGYNDGFSSGFKQGIELGQNRGYESGYDEGYDAGFELGQSQGFSSGYNEGYDEGYDEGFTAGADSVDTDSFYNSGYEAGEFSGYSQGYEAGYNAAYDTAYEAGYNDAVEKLTGTGVVQNESKTVNKTFSISNSSLDIEDVNTTLPVVYQNVKDFETYLDDSISVGDISGEFWYIFDPDELQLIEGDLSVDTSDHTQYTFGWDEKDYTYGLGYYVDGVQKLFTASTDAYAYKVTVKQSGTTYTRSDVWKAWNLVGTQSEVLSGFADLGSRFYSASTLEHTFFIYTDNLPVDIYSGVLFYFFDSDKTAASYNLSSTLTVTYTPYTRTEYKQIIDAIDDLGGKIDDLGDTVTQGFDSSAGDTLNNDFSAHLTEYQTAEDSLFSAAQSGLDSFTFVDFSSYPALVTAMSFVTSMMTSIYISMGGESGPIGIVLSVLFSVMLVSMAIGLYRFYQSKGKGGGD